MCVYNRTVYSCNHSYLTTLVQTCTGSDSQQCGEGVWHGYYSRRVNRACPSCLERESMMGELREGVDRCRATLDRWILEDLEAELEVEAELDSLETLSDEGPVEEGYQERKKRGFELDQKEEELEKNESGKRKEKEVESKSSERSA